MLLHYKKIKFISQFNKLKLLGKNRVAKSFSMALGVEISKKINTYLSTNIKILDFFSVFRICSEM